MTCIDSVKSCFENETAVPDGINKAMMGLLYIYIIVRGLPEVVNCFLETDQLAKENKKFQYSALNKSKQLASCANCYTK